MGAGAQGDLDVVLAAFVIAPLAAPMEVHLLHDPAVGAAVGAAPHERVQTAHFGRRLVKPDVHLRERTALATRSRPTPEGTGHAHVRYAEGPTPPEAPAGHFR